MSTADQPYQEYRDKPWGHEVIYTPTNLARAGKILYVNAGTKLSLQYHDLKEETICVLEGDGILWLGSSAEDIQKIPMQAEHGYTIYPGQVHRLEAITACRFLEVSDSEKGTTFRLQDDYKRDDEVR
jgi:mannose-6-phosphate isomerase